MIFEIIINLTVSLVLVNKLGIVGVLIGTIISLLAADFATKPIVIFKKILETTPEKYYIMCICNFIFAIVEIVWINFAFKTVYTSVLECIVYGIIIGIINLAISFIYFYFTKQLEFLKRLKKQGE